MTIRQDRGPFWPQPIGTVTGRVALWALLILLVVLFGLGGSARADVASLQLLRPVTVLCLAVGLVTLQRQHLTGYGLPLLLAFAAVALPALQLLPLPPSLWSGLPGRELVAAIDEAAGLAPLWRPLSLSPAGTLNALGAALAPLAILVLAIQLPAPVRAALIVLPLSFGVAGALLGMAQILSPEGSGLYFFDITNRGSAVGLFANRNHQAVALACLIPLGAAAFQLFWPARWRDGRGDAVRHGLLLLGVAALVPLILVTGSRAGLLACAIGIASLIFIVTGSRPSEGWLPRRGGLALGMAVVIGIAAMAIWQGRDLALDRLLGSSPGDDLRVQMLPTLWRMGADHAVWGTGLGTFERVYQIYEQADLLGPAYVNHAHNDWLELVITGGVPAMALIAAGICGLWARAFSLWNPGLADRLQPLRRAALACILMLAMASVADYPLRTPYLASLFALSIVWLFIPNYDTRKH